MEKNFAINLKEYIEQDKIYQDYKKRKLENKSDFDEFCINHCEDIENALDEILKLRIKISAMDTINNQLDNENQELKEEFAKLWDEYNKLKDKYDKDIEYLGKIADDYRDKNKELKSLCDKYEEEHNNEFQCWKRDRKELLDKRNRINKAVGIIKKYGYEKQMEEDYLMNRVNLANYNCLLLDILKGDNK